MTTLEIQRKQMDIKMKEDVPHEYEVPIPMTEYEVPIPMIKMTECEAYGTCTLPHKPWHTQAIKNGVVLVVYMMHIEL